MEMNENTQAEILSNVRNKALEEAAKAVEPSTPRPCDCVHCDCGNSGDARNVAWWDEGANSAAAIRALKTKEAE